MASKKSKSSAKKSGADKPVKLEERIDRRFMPTAITPPWLLYGLTAIGAVCIGAGVYAQFLRPEWMMLEPAPWAFWPLAGGGFLVAAAIWFSSNGDPAVRVGSPGIAEERNGVHRIPWYGLSSVRFNDARGALLIEGVDEAGASFTFPINVRAHRAAAAHVLAETKRRRADALEIDESVQKEIGPADPNAGLRIKEPLQVVGRRCVESGKILAYEPDARVCPRCERVYHKRHVPKTCACGADLSAQRDGMLPKDLEASDAKSDDGANSDTKDVAKSDDGANSDANVAKSDDSAAAS